MAIDDVLYDRKTKSGAAHIARTPRVNPIEPFGKARDVNWIDAFAMVGDRDG